MTVQVENISTGRVYDISNCDKEPIHIPGSIQPHGYLFAVSEPSLAIEQLSQNAGALLGMDAEKAIGWPLQEFFTEESMNTLRGALNSPDARANNPLTFAFRGRPERYSGIIHRFQDTLVVEIEPALGGDAAERLDRYNRTRAAISALRGAKSLDELCTLACEQIRSLTGFDRVVVYYFDRDWNGAVIAEARSGKAESFMGLHFPATDIPRQARELYALNWLRLIPTVEYSPSPIVPAVNPRTGGPLDLSYSVLRSVSPIHVEYLKNMGLTASMSVSLMKGDGLWGLISCAALDGPRLIPYETRASCEFIAEVMSSLLAEKTQLEDYDEKVQTRRLHDRLVSALAQSDNFLSALANEEERVLELMRASGGAISFRGSVALLGASPKPEQVHRLITWLDEKNTELYETDSLKRDYPDWADLGPSFCGLLAVKISRSSQGQYLLWFRPEVAQTVTWGGDPNKPATGDGLRLHPRKSFAQWKEVVRDKSVPWRADEIGNARDLQRAIADLILSRAERLENLIEELKRSNFELDSFAYAASHDLKEPVRGIHNYADFLRRETGLSEKGKARLETIYRLTERMDGLLNSLLEYSQVGRTELALETVDLQELVGQATEMVGPILQERGAEVTVDGTLPKVKADRVRVGQLLANLISNGIKYNEQTPPRITIGAAPGTGGHVFYVRDNGIGIPADQAENVFRIFKRLHGKDDFGGGSGTGLTSAKAIAERHGGEMWFDSEPGRGTTFFFTLQRKA
jgi:two-component system, chemotaxis family, sensor kinase Cph1